MQPGGDFPKVEQPPRRPESGQEAPEQAGGFEAPAPQERAGETQPAPAAVPSAPPQAGPAAKDPIVGRVEDVLEEGLADTYKSMAPGLQRKFRAEGERVAGELAGIIRSLKLNVSRVLKLITGWLKIIPGVNRFFLDQEAKLKTDRIMALAEEERKRRGTA
jgi:hypothetical protein